jgi:exopolysaccharide production protein ExoY
MNAWLWPRMIKGVCDWLRACFSFLDQKQNEFRTLSEREAMDCNVIKQPQRSEGHREVCPTVPAWKRILDITCVVIASPVLLPTMLAIALLIRFTSGTPTLFFQERIGLGGKRFTCVKFRTMKVDADVGIHRRYLVELMQSDKPTSKMDERGDARIIPFGLFLRSAGMDELPQIINVLKGQMSLVGPRPCLPYEYENCEAAQKARYDSLPGLTGLWQVSGRDKTTYSDMIALDIKYAQNKSLWLDIKILLKTIPALVLQVREMRRLRKTSQK